MAVVELRADFDQLREIVALGVRRASIFMGIGANAAGLDPPLSHVLDDKAQFVVVPQEVSAKVSSEFLREFENWVVANGLRDLVETFSIFLAETYAMHFLFEKGQVLAEDFERAKRRFEFKGVEQQLAAMNQLLALDGRFLSMYSSLNQARNCMAHRRGIVGLVDVPARNQPFVFTWRTRAMFLEDGRDVSVLLQCGEEVHVEAGQKIVNSEVERSKNFALGEPIRLSRHELNEICFGVTIAMENVRSGLIEFARSKGHKIIEKPAAE
jgi:hypothetical protein